MKKVLVLVLVLALFCVGFVSAEVVDHGNDSVWFHTWDVCYPQSVSISYVNSCDGDIVHDFRGGGGMGSIMSDYSYSSYFIGSIFRSTNDFVHLDSRLPVRSRVVVENTYPGQIADLYVEGSVFANGDVNAKNVYASSITVSNDLLVKGCIIFGDDTRICSAENLSLSSVKR